MVFLHLSKMMFLLFHLPRARIPQLLTLRIFAREPQLKDNLTAMLDMLLPFCGKSKTSGRNLKLKYRQTKPCTGLSTSTVPWSASRNIQDFQGANSVLIRVGSLFYKSFEKSMLIMTASAQS